MSMDMGWMEGGGGGKAKAPAAILLLCFSWLSSYSGSVLTYDFIVTEFRKPFAGTVPINSKGTLTQI